MSLQTLETPSAISDAETSLVQPAPRPQSSGARGTFARLLRNPSALSGISIVLAIISVSSFAGFIFQVDPMDMVAAPLIWPFTDMDHLLGTDMLGRDVLVGLVYAARVSITVGLSSAALSVVVGCAVGAVSGYFGGWVDQLLTRVTEVFQTMPPFVFTVAIVTILTPSIGSIIVGIAITSWPQIARLVRAEALRLRDAEFVQAARVMGMCHRQIILTHILPNAVSPVIVAGSILVASSILAEAALSFLGLGDPQMMSWGSMIGTGREAMRTAWYLTALPGLAISLTVMALNMIGSGLNDILNPRTLSK